MLTIKQPIRLSARPSMIKLDDSLGRRVEANYQVMASTLSPESMLHFVSGQSDVYMEGDSMTSLVSMNSRINTQQINVELINNVLNRILVSDNSTLSYQDRTFVDMVLSRMGITDVKQFMHQVSILKQNTQNVNKLIELYHKGGDILQEITQQYKKVNIENEKKEADIITEEHFHDMWLHQTILNRLETGEIYKEIENFYRAMYDTHKYIDAREFNVGEQLVQSWNISLNQIKNRTMYHNEPLEYRTVNTYEMGDVEEYLTEGDHIRSELIEAVILNAVNNAYALRYNEINDHSGVWYSLTESIRQTAENTLSRFEDFHEHANITFLEADQYNRSMQENITNEITSLQMLYEQYDNTNEYREEAVEQQIVQRQENHIHGQQINHLSQEEELLKQQLEIINRTNLEKQEKLEQIINQIKPSPRLQINRTKAMADARKAMENSQEVMLEYMNSQNTVEHYETQTREQLEKVIDKNVLKIFEQIEQYHRNPDRIPENITVNDAALASFMRDTSLPPTPREKLVEQHVEEKVDTMIHDTRQQEIKSQLERIISKEAPEVKYVSNPKNVELFHKVTQTGINEELLEEIRNVNRNVTRNVEQHVENVQEKEDIYTTVTNRVNEIQLQQNEELSHIIASNVREQLGSLSDQVYRKLEKRMDSEKRRRGL